MQKLSGTLPESLKYTEGDDRATKFYAIAGNLTDEDGYENFLTVADLQVIFEYLVGKKTETDLELAPDPDGTEPGCIELGYVS